MSKAHQYHYIPACPESTSPNKYVLLTRQQPAQTRVSTDNERERKPIDPPPIIQIKYFQNATLQEIDTFHQNSFLFMCANLVHGSDDHEIYTPTHNALSGQTVSSMYKLKDINDLDGAFFIFGDLSVKVEGCFRLKLSLFEITTTGPVCLQSIFTSPFNVYSSKMFPGMLDSTFLSRSFSDQGARIRIRKDNRKRKLVINDKDEPHRRKLSISSGTESCNSSQSDYSSPVLRSKSPLQAYHKTKEFDMNIKLPSISNIIGNNKSLTEQEAVLAMIRLSSTHS